MDENSRQDRIDAIRKNKEARRRKTALIKIILTCVLVIAIAVSVVLVKHSADKRNNDAEASAINTVSTQTTSEPDFNQQPITASTTQKTTVTATENSEAQTALPSTSTQAQSTTEAVTEYTIKSHNATMYTKEKVNMRSEPNTKSKIITEIAGSQEVKVTGICSNNWYQIEYNGKTGFCSANYLSDKKVTKTGYLLKVNRTQNIVTVYKADDNGEYTVPVKAMVCSVGLNGKTPTGTFTTTDKYTWRLLSGNVYGQYATRITGHILFHSVPYFTQNKADLEYEEYNKLGQAASLGCVRLCVRDAKWIYDNCKSGTTVVIYDSSSPEPLTPSRPIRIDTSSPNRGWDPTDPDPKNPW